MSALCRKEEAAKEAHRQQLADAKSAEVEAKEKKKCEQASKAQQRAAGRANKASEGSQPGVAPCEGTSL